MKTYEPGKPAIDFFHTGKISRNIFNNFDISRYLNHRLSPTYKTFINNRPEAFPKEFFGQMIRDKNWKAMYVDEYAVIFTKKRISSKGN